MYQRTEHPGAQDTLEIPQKVAKLALGFELRKTPSFLHFLDTSIIQWGLSQEA